MTKIHRITKQVNKDAMALLEEFIELVKSGDIDSVAVCYTTPDSIGWKMSDTPNDLKMWSSMVNMERSYHFNRTMELVE